MAYCQLFGLMVIFNIKLSIQEKNHVLGWPILNFIAISFKWKFPAYCLSGLLKRSITNDNCERKKIEDLIMSIKCHRLKN